MMEADVASTTQRRQGGHELQTSKARFEATASREQAVGGPTRGASGRTAACLALGFGRGDRNPCPGSRSRHGSRCELHGDSAFARRLALDRHGLRSAHHDPLRPRDFQTRTRDLGPPRRWRLCGRAASGRLDRAARGPIAPAHRRGPGLFRAVALRRLDVAVLAK